jgi:hypothetical protein
MGMRMGDNFTILQMVIMPVIGIIEKKQENCRYQQQCGNYLVSSLIIHVYFKTAQNYQNLNITPIKESILI